MNETGPKNKIGAYLSRHKRFGIILAGIITLNMLYGFDPRFTIINLLWVFISVVKIDKP
ncbi:MAG TPA: hypothetical protein VD905_20220 [Flavobacteriales bacterium]|nr:hypothetical protein [Flavobacteriales bacterium]